MSVPNTTNKNNCLTDSCFSKNFKTLFQSFIFCGSSDTSRWISPLATNFFILSDAIMSSMYPKAEEIFSEKESMIGILGKKTELEEYLPILKLFYREGENLFSDVTIPAQYSVDGKEYIVNSQEEFL